MEKQKKRGKAIADIAIFLIVFCLSIILTIPASAQDSGEHIEDILRWFPRGHYDMLLHHNWVALREAETYPLYVTFFRPFDDPLLPVIELPLILRRDLKSRTVAQLQHIEARSFDSRDAMLEYETARRGVVLQETVGEHFYSLESTGERLMVFRYFVLDDLMEEALSRQDIFITDLILLERPIYTFLARVDKEFKQFFAWSSPAQELLIASTPALLERMVNAGAGQGLRLLDGRDYEDLRYLTEELGQSWQLKTRYPHLRRMLALVRARRMPQTMVAYFENLLEYEPKFSIQARRLDETLSFFTVTLFTDLEIAQKWMEEKSLYQNVGILSSEFLSQNLLLFFKPQTFERLGSSVISRLNYEEATVADLWDEWEQKQEQYLQLQEEAEGAAAENF